MINKKCLKGESDEKKEDIKKGKCHFERRKSDVKGGCFTGRECQ